MHESKKHVVVVGGGIAGTSAAHELTRLGYKVTIVEKRNRLGGRVHSHLVNGVAVEMGAGFLTKEYKNLWGFLERTSLDRSLYRQKSKTGVYVDKKVYMLTPRTLLVNKPLALSSKLHAASLLMKTFMNWRKLDLRNFWGASDIDDRSVAMMYRSKSGIDFMEKALQPVLNGYFYWSPEHTSEAMLLILSRAAFSHGTYRLKGGLQQIPEAAAQESNVLFGHSVETIRKSPDGSYAVNFVAGAKTKSISADAIICATTASVVSRIFPNLTDRQRAFFEAIKYSSAALITRTYPKEERVNDTSIAFPRKQGIDLSSVTISTEQGEGGMYYSTVKTYASGAVAKERIAQTNEDLTNRLIDDMQPVSEHVLMRAPTSVAQHIQRWDEALPYFDVGHFKRLAEFHEGRIEDGDEQIAFAGDYLGGPFMEGAFTSGLQAARRLHDRLESSQTFRKDLHL